MSSPSFLFANETNFSLLISLLEALNAMIEHQFSSEYCVSHFSHCGVCLLCIENPNLIYAILRSRKRFESLQEFTLESAQEELERQKAETDSSNGGHHSRGSSIDTTLRSSISARSPHLSNVPEEHGAFAIGDDEDVSEGEEAASASQPLQPKRPTNTQSTEFSASVSSSTDDVPPQLRGMSEKARGKMPVGTPSFSRQNSMTSLHNLTPVTTTNGGA